MTTITAMTTAAAAWLLMSTTTTNAGTPATMVRTLGRPKSRPIPKLPAACSPQLLRSRLELRTIACSGPTPSTTRNGATRHVARL